MKEYMSTIIIAAGIIIGIIMLIAYIRSGKPISSFLRHCAGGIGTLALVNMFSGISGIALPFNLFSLSSVGLLGVPGTASLLICNLIFK